MNQDLVVLGAVHTMNKKIDWQLFEADAKYKLRDNRWLYRDVGAQGKKDNNCQHDRQ